MGLRKRVFSAVCWSFAQRLTVQLCSFSITIVLARILTPADFGLIATMSGVMAMGNVLVEGGISASLIRTIHISQREYSTVFFFNILLGFTLFCIVYVTSPIISIFFDENVLTPLMRIYALDFIINALFCVQSVRLVKEMNFRVQTIVEVPCVVIGGGMGVYFAYRGYGVWSLVWMQLVKSFLCMASHWVLSDWKPSFLFDIHCLRRHINFGYKVSLSSILDVLYRYLYVLIIGKFYSIVQLGYYSRADSLSQLPTMNAVSLINRVAYPMFALIGSDDGRLKKVYRRLIKQIFFLNASVLVSLAIVAEPIFLYFFIFKWLPAVPYFQLFCLSGVMLPLHAYSMNILKVKGRSDLVLRIELIKKAICVVGVISVFSFGIIGLLLFQLAFNLFGFYINILYISKLLDYPVFEQISDLLPILLLVGICGVSSYIIDRFYIGPGQLDNLIRIAINGFLFFSAFFGSSIFLKIIPLRSFNN